MRHRTPNEEEEADETTRVGWSEVPSPLVHPWDGNRLIQTRCPPALRVTRRSLLLDLVEAAGGGIWCRDGP